MGRHPPKRARLRGLPAATEHDLEEALFTDGFTTRDAVSDLSGRGVGLSAVRQVCHQLGGTIRVNSRRGLGTRFEFRFAPAVEAPAPTAEPPRTSPDAHAQSCALHGQNA